MQIAIKCTLFYGYRPIFYCRYQLQIRTFEGSPNLRYIGQNIKVIHWYSAEDSIRWLWYGPLARYVKLRVSHAPGMLRTFSPPPRVSDPDLHHGTSARHVPWCMPGSLTSVFLWSKWRGKRSRHSRRMHKPQFYVSGKKPIVNMTAICSICQVNSASHSNHYLPIIIYWD